MPAAQHNKLLVPLNLGSMHTVPEDDAPAKLASFFARGGIAGVKGKSEAAACPITIFQRKPKKIAGRGKTTGWIHRAALDAKEAIQGACLASTA